MTPGVTASRVYSSAATPTPASIANPGTSHP
jgi:hypothetical protein